MKFLAHTARFAALVVIAGSAFSQPANAAPFCIRNQIIQPQCMYYDAHQCEQEAQKQNAECVANPAELRMTQAHGEYCVVTSGRVSICAYADRTSCAAEASRQHGTCIPAEQNAPQRTPDPYSPFNGR